VLTIITVPKPFRGHIGDIQRNAIESWRTLRSDVQVVLVGDEEGVEKAARDAGVEHAGGLAHNDCGTPRLDSAFERAARLSRWPLWCFVNADILLLNDFSHAIERVSSAFRDFLIVGESRDLHVDAEAQLEDGAVRSRLREQALQNGRLRGYAALDYFVFRRGLFDPVPPFLIGRACFDNWLVWRARELGRPVVDVTRSVVVVHQSHDYSHVSGGLEEAYYGEEARYNERLAGGREHIYSLHESTHRLYRHGPPLPYWGSIFRMREKARLARVSMEIQLAARRDRKKPSPLEEHPLRLVAVAAAPTAETTGLLDALSEDHGVDLDVLYPATPTYGTSTPSPQHAHWFARTTRLRRLDRFLGRDYPITWTIWHSFYFLRPDCMLIFGWSTFPAEAAIAWCIARRVPYVLVIEEHQRRVRHSVGRRLHRVLVDAVTRRSDGVLVPAWIDTSSLPLEQGRHLPETTEKAARAVLHLARCARDARRHHRERPRRFGYGSLSIGRRVKRGAQTPRSRSESPGRRG
jgi:hypothetical protein